MNTTFPRPASSWPFSWPVPGTNWAREVLIPEATMGEDERAWEAELKCRINQLGGRRSR